MVSEEPACRGPGTANEPCVPPATLWQQGMWPLGPWVLCCQSSRQRIWGSMSREADAFHTHWKCAERNGAAHGAAHGRPSPRNLRRGQAVPLLGSLHESEVQFPGFPVQLVSLSPPGFGVAEREPGALSPRGGPDPPTGPLSGGPLPCSRYRCPCPTRQWGDPSSCPIRRVVVTLRAWRGASSRWGQCRGKRWLPGPQSAALPAHVLPACPFPGQLSPLLALPSPPRSISGPGEEWAAETWNQAGPWWLQLSPDPQPRFLSSLAKCRVGQVALSPAITTGL